MAGGRSAEQLSVRDIALMLKPETERLCWFLFPSGKAIGGYFNIGSVDGEPGKSLKVNLRGPKRGGWVDYTVPKGHPRGDGDLLDLIQQALGLDKAGAVNEAKRFLHLENMDPNLMARARERAKVAQERAERRALGDVERRARNAHNLWRTSSPLVPSSPPVKYLAHRGIDFAKLGKLPGAIRFKPDMIHAELGRDRPQPAMITRMIALDGTTAAAHVTFLERRADGIWVKLREVADKKKIFGPAWDLGAHMPLWKGAQNGTLRDIAPGTAVEVSEGIEDGLSFAMADPTARVVAAGTVGLIGQMRLPVQAGQLNILAQRDDKEQAVEALKEAIRKQQIAAREDRSERVVACRWPKRGFKDWNDWLRGEVA
jgi:hypothetical protein